MFAKSKKQHDLIKGKEQRFPIASPALIETSCSWRRKPAADGVWGVRKSEDA